MKILNKTSAGLVLIFVLFVFIFSCAEVPPQKPEEPEVFWPLPPEKPKIKFVKSYSNTFDVEGLPTFLERIGGVRFYSLQAPQGVAVDKDGNIYVSDSTRSLIVIFKPGEKKMDFFGINPSERISIPLGLTVARNANMLLVAAGGTKNVVGFDLKTGRMKLNIAGFTNPAGVAVDEARGRIYVTDSKTSELKVFDMTGRFIMTIAKQGSNNNQLATPTQVAVDKQGNIYVADLFNFRVKIFSPDGKFLKAIGSGPCTGMGCFSKLNGVAVDSDGNIYTVDTDFGVVQIFSQNGELLLPFAGMGPTPGALMLPMQIYIDDNDMIYVADTFNYRINVYQYLK